MKIKTSDLYEKNGITIQVDDVNGGMVYFAKYAAHIGDRVSWNEFRGFYKMPVDAFRRQIKAEIKN